LIKRIIFLINQKKNIARKITPLILYTFTCSIVSLYCIIFVKCKYFLSPFSRTKKEAKEEEENIMRRKKQTQSVKLVENTRLQDFRRKQYAAMRIQKAWRK